MHASHTGAPDGVDLALPAGATLALLMPSIVDILCGRDEVTCKSNPPIRIWGLSRVGGKSLDESMTLTENGIDDGDLLVLSTTEPTIHSAVVDDPFRVAANSVAAPAKLPTITVSACCLWAVGLSMMALMSTRLHTDATGSLIAAAGLTAVTVAAAVVDRFGADPLTRATLSVAAVASAAAMGFLAVPAGPGAPNACLAASAACCTAVVLLRLTRCATVCLTAIATLSVVAAVAAAVGVVWTVPVALIGATLVTVSLGVLTASPRMAIAMAGLVDQVSDVHSRAARGHHMLTGLLVGSASSAALGAAVVAVAAGSDDNTDAASWVRAAAFTAAVGVLLVLRSRSHSDLHRKTVLLVCGIVSLTAGFVLIVVAIPDQVTWPSLLAAAAGLAVVWPAPVVSPLLRRAVDVGEYVALAAVVPLACWVADVYSVVRDLSLP